MRGTNSYHVTEISQGWMLLGDHSDVFLPEISSLAEIKDAAAVSASPLLSVHYPPSQPDGTPDIHVAKAVLEGLLSTSYREVRDCVVIYSIDHAAPDLEDSRRPEEPAAVDGGAPLQKESCWGWLLLIDPAELGGAVHQTEEVFDDRVQERAHLLSNLECFTSAAMVITSDLRGEMARLGQDVAAPKPADLEVVDHDGCRHRLWVVEDKELCAQVIDAACRTTLLVADGNHRAEAAQKAGLTGMLAFLTDDPGVRMAPMHRALHPPGFSAEDVVHAWLPAVVNATPRRDVQPSRGRIIVADDDTTWEVVLPTEALEDARKCALAIEEKGVWLTEDGGGVGLEYHYVDKVLFEQFLGLDPTLHMTPLQDVNKVPTRDTNVMVLMPRISKEELEQVAIGERLPRKSTVFGPKPLTGVFLAHTPAREEYWESAHRHPTPRK